MKRTPLKKKTKVTSEKLRQKCVELAKKIVKKQSNYICAYCKVKKEPRSIHGSHIYSEGIYRAMSADLDNILAICNIHHLAGKWNKADKWSWHGTPKEAIEWFEKNYPKRAETLKKRTRQSVQADEYYWTQKLKELEKIWRKIN